MAKYLTYNGETHSCREWSRILGLSTNTVYSRLKNGWEIEKVLSTKLFKTGKKERKVKCVETGVIYNSVNECADDFFIDPSNIRNNARGKTRSCYGFHFEYVED